jgi:hypothetical protein
LRWQQHADYAELALDFSDLSSTLAYSDAGTRRRLPLDTAPGV